MLGEAGKAQFRRGGGKVCPRFIGLREYLPVGVIRRVHSRYKKHLVQNESH